MYDNGQLAAGLDPGRCALTDRIQIFLEAVADRGDAGALLGEHFCLQGLESGSLPLDRNRPAPLVTEAQLFGLGQAAPGTDTPVELRLIAYGVKPLALLHAPEPQLAGWVAWAERRGWTALLSSWQWQPREDRGKGGYSNLTADHCPAEAGSGAWRSLVVSPDEDRAAVGWLCVHYGWDRMLGRLLGYPDCCAESFRERWPDAVRRHQGDLAPLTLAASGPPPHDWRVNVFARYFGAALIQHFPCRFDCAPSARTAERAAAALGHFEPEYLDAVGELLRAPILYTEDSGVILARGGEVRREGGALQLHYDPRRLLFTDPDASSSRAMRAGSPVRAREGEPGFRLGADACAGHLVWFT